VNYGYPGVWELIYSYVDRTKEKIEMERCSYFVQNRALFGSFPVQAAVEELENEGVRYFVNLTSDSESKITQYTTKYGYINYPIPDRYVPKDWGAFARFIIRVADIITGLSNGDKVYIHCKGGHGRSGVVVACLLVHMFGMSPERALAKTSNYHSKRREMRKIWRKVGSPQTPAQKAFVQNFFQPLYFYRAYKTGYTTGFSNFSTHPVSIEGMGTFPTSEAAIQAHKDLENPEYVQRQLTARCPAVSRHLGNGIVASTEWYENRSKLMRKILRAKFEQNPNILRNLIGTGLRPIVQHMSGECFWSDGGDGNGHNVLGRLLTELRNEIYQEE
jgi:ribA/ribD-fused uncharacterized protein